MSFLYVVGFGFKVGNLILMLCCWFVNLVSMNWIVNNGTMTVKYDGGGGGGGQIWKKLCEKLRNSEEGNFKIHQHSYSQYIEPKKVGKTWWRKLLVAWIVVWIIASIWVFWYMTSHAQEKRKETLGSMCDERARMLQDQFSVHANHIQAISMLISIFHHSKNTSAIDQMTFASYTERTAFERPLTSGVAYAVRVLQSEREQFEKQQGWTIKRMDTLEQTPPVPERSPMQEEYAPVIFAQDTIAHVISLDMLSGKEDRENILRARESGKGVLTAPFRLIKSNRLGVILTFAVYKTDLPSNASSEERTQATDGYLGGVFDVESLVEKLLQQLASKQTILVNVYDTTDVSHPISMYGSNVSNEGLLHICNLNFGDPFRKHEMHCRFKHKPPYPWLAISGSIGLLVIALLLGQIFHATMNRIAKVEDDYHEMMELQKRAQAADAAKSRFLATVSHEIRTPMNGVLGMLHMLMDTDLDVTQQDYVTTAQASGRALVSLINEVLDQAKIESGKLELEAVQFDLRGILDDVLSLFSGKSQENGVELAVYISDKVPEMVIGDPGRFRQIITNLMGNSIKFTEKGHIFVTVHLVDEIDANMEEFESCSRNTLSGFPVADRRKSWDGFKVFEEEDSSSLISDQINIIVSVEDTGSGIPLDAQSRIFTPFMQVGPSISRTHGGTGIGLSISKCLVHLMQGEIGFVSVPKVGSTFTFTAVFSTRNPTEQQSQQIINKQAKAVSSEFKGMSALIVDPRPVRAKVSMYHIQRLGVNVEVFPDMNRALSCLKTEHSLPDIVLVEQDVWDTDLNLSKNFLRELSAIVQNRNVPKVFLLANSIKGNRPKVSINGITGPAIITKPLRASMLAASLQRAMGVGLGGNCRNGDHLRNLTLSKLLHGRKILVVDDNKVNLKVAEGFLKKYGAEVARVESGREAVSLLHPPHHFDACFMDIQMPEMDGFEATCRIRKTESKINAQLQKGECSVEDYGDVKEWHVPILAMTADVIQATNEECQKYGMDGYISKPFEAEQLYHEVSRFFEIDDDDDDVIPKAANVG